MSEPLMECVALFKEATDLLPRPIPDKYKELASQIYNDLAFAQVLNGEYNSAKSSLEKAIGLTSDKNQMAVIERNLAHSYLMSGEYEKAKTLYLKYLNEKFGDYTWQSLVADDFIKMKLYLVSSPFMDSLTHDFNKAVYSKLSERRKSGQKVQLSFASPDFMRVSPDRNYIATVTKSENIAKVEVYDVFTGMPIREYSYSDIIDIEFTNDSQYLVTLCVENSDKKSGSLIFSNIVTIVLTVLFR